MGFLLVIVHNFQGKVLIKGRLTQFRLMNSVPFKISQLSLTFGFCFVLSKSCNQYS